MHAPNPFNLKQAIAAYIREINRNGMLSREERQEVSDHLFTATESFLEAGYEEPEAFRLAVEEFGSSELIGEEYQRVKPFYTVRKAIIGASLLVFFFSFVVGLMYATSLGVLFLAKQFPPIVSVITYVDLGVKLLLLGGLGFYLRWRLSCQHALTTWEARLVPALGVVAPSVTIYCYFFQGYFSPDIIYKGHFNNYIFLLLLLVSGLIICYRWIFQWNRSRKRSISENAIDAKARIGIMVAFFLSLTVFSLVSIISAAGIWVASYDILSEAWIKLLDFVLKLILLGGMLSIVFSRIEKKIFFRRFELLVIPILGFISPHLVDLLFLALGSPGNFNRALFGTLSYNSQLLLGFTFVIVFVTTYVLMYQERKALRMAK